VSLKSDTLVRQPSCLSSFYSYTLNCRVITSMMKCSELPEDKSLPHDEVPNASGEQVQRCCCSRRSPVLGHQVSDEEHRRNQAISSMVVIFWRSASDRLPTCRRDNVNIIVTMDVPICNLRCTQSLISFPTPLKCYRIQLYHSSVIIIK
jgi:hypothetical protein